MTVPFMDLAAQNGEVADTIRAGMDRVIEASDFILGKDVGALETEFAQMCEVPHAVGVDSGISSLELALRALGIGPGDEVITVSHTFIATVSAISFTGATPVFVDVDPETYTMDAARAEAAVTSRTKALLPVHLYGQPADMDGLLAVAERHGLALVEDACQAHGARYRGRRVGGLGDAGCFSFYPAKNLGCFGDGGMLVTRRGELAERVRMLRNYGQREKYRHEFLAYNRRLDTLQAVVLRAKLPRLDAWNAGRRQAAAWYAEGLVGVADLVVPREAEGREHVWHLYVVQHPRRDALAEHLKARGIATGLHYPTPVHLQSCYEKLGVGQGALPVSERVAACGLSLPMFPHLREDQVAAVCEAVRAF